MVPILKRVQVAQSTIDAFLNQPFKWGERDCGDLASFALYAFGLPGLKEGWPRYTSAMGCRKACKKMGVKTIPDYLDSRFERIAPAAALPGDIVGFPGGAGLGVGLGVHIGDGRCLAFADGDEHRCIFGTDQVATHAWRVI